MMKVSKQAMLRLQKKNNAQQKEIDALQKKDKTSQKEKDMMQKENEMLQKTINELQNNQNCEDVLWNVTDMSNRHGISPVQLHSREMIHAILHDDKRLTTMTSYDRDMFDYLRERFLVELKKVPNLPLFSEDQNENPGNRCMLDKESVFLLALIESRSNEQQAKLGVWFDVDQSTVSRYLKFAKPLVEEILPTAKKMTGIIKSIKTKKEFEKLVPKSTLLPDATEVSKERSQNKDERKASYSGKKKDFTLTTNIVTTLDGLIIWSGKTFKGATHDLAMLKQNKIDLGRWSKGMFKKDTPEGKRITVLADKGYLGLEKYYPGIKFVMPKKKPKGRELTAREKIRNKKISSRRIKVEHAIGAMKRWRILKDSYDGTIDDFELDFSICTGHANFKRLWDPNKKQPRIDY